MVPFSRVSLSRVFSENVHPLIATPANLVSSIRLPVSRLKPETDEPESLTFFMPDPPRSSRRLSLEPAMTTSFISAVSMRSSCTDAPARELSTIALSVRSAPRRVEAENALSRTFERTRRMPESLLKITRFSRNSKDSPSGCSTREEFSAFPPLRRPHRGSHS